MTTPNAPIYASDVNNELGRGATASFNINDAGVRALAGVASGYIDFNALRNKSNWNITVARSSTASVDRVTLTSNQNCTWNYSFGSHGNGTVGASPANGGAATSGAYSLTGRQSGSTINNDSVTVNITATYNGQTKTFAYTFNVGNQ